VAKNVLRRPALAGPAGGERQTMQTEATNREEIGTDPSQDQRLHGGGTRRLLRRPARLAVLVTLLVAGSGALGARALASSVSTEGRHCSVATLHGTYQWANEGTQTAGSPKGPFSYAGQSTFDGQGHVIKGVFSGSSDGQAYGPLTYTGTYTVNPDCTGTEVDTPASGPAEHYAEYDAPNGSRYTYVELDAGIVSAGTGYR
jgi:hypothetical protein